MSGTRAQAYTLEALIAAVLLLTAVLFALNAVVITPTTAGTLGGDAQASFKGEASDALVTADNEGELDYLARYFNASDENDGMAGEWEEGPGFREWPDDEPFVDFGTTLDHLFEEQGRRYNVELVWREPDGEIGSEDVVFQGSPGDEVVVATHTVILTDDMRVTDPEGEAKRLGEAHDDGEFPIPETDIGGTDSQVYNVVEVRVVVW